MTTLHRFLGCLVLTLTPTLATALTPADFTLASGLSVRLINANVIASYDAAGDEFHTLANGALLVPDLSLSPDTLTLRRLNDNGTIDFLASINGRGSVTTDPATGAIWMRARLATDTYEFWKIEGLPRTRGSGGCPNPPGDLAPGTLDSSTVPPTFTAVGNGAVDGGDVVTLLRASVGLQTVVCSP